MRFKRILIALDSEPVAVHAADRGLELARALSAEVAFIHVLDAKAVVAPESGVPADEMVALAEADARRLMARFRDRLEGGTSSLEFIPSGRPATEIVNAAKQWPADLIVIGSHGRGAIGRTLLGSVAEAILRHAPCPVLVIKASA